MLAAAGMKYVFLMNCLVIHIFPQILSENFCAFQPFSKVFLTKQISNECTEW